MRRTGNSWVLLAVCVSWLAFQLYLLFHPIQPILARPFHLCFALAAFYLWDWKQKPRNTALRTMACNIMPLAIVSATALYYLLEANRFTTRMEGVDPVFARDIVFCLLLLLTLLEAVRRTVGWSLLSVIILFVFYGFAGPYFPGQLAFSGLSLREFTEIMAMSLEGLFGITTQTSLELVFYFVVFGAIYTAVGGGQLLIDIGLSLAGKRKAGPARAAIVASSLIGSVTGSAVANVSTTGVFTIPLMHRAGYRPEQAAAIEAVASTGGQLMPPILGVAAFVMAELLQVEYLRVAAAALIPALAYYLALFLLVGFEATSRPQNSHSPLPNSTSAITARLYLLIPLLVLVGLLFAGYSPASSASVGAGVALLVGLFPKLHQASNLLLQMLRDAGVQAAQVAIPISAIGIILAVTVQSNLALKFSAALMAAARDNLPAALLLVIVGCLIMGMGLPTVAAYIIGAILFVPALTKLGVSELAAHFFVFYYCVLSMITPPVALASYAAAGLAGTNPTTTSFIAFRYSLVCFLVPLGFAFDPHLLGQGTLAEILVAAAGLFLSTAAWAVALAGKWTGPLRVLFPRLFCGLLAVTLVVTPTGHALWYVLVVAVVGCLVVTSGLMRKQT